MNSTRPIADHTPHIEELLPQGKEILRSGNGRQVPCRSPIDSSLDPALKGQDCAELPVQAIPAPSSLNGLEGRVHALFIKNFLPDLSEFSPGKSPFLTVWNSDGTKAYYSHSKDVIKRDQPIAILTCSGLDNYKEDDHRTAHILERELEVPVRHVVWNQPNVDWKQYQAAVVRSTWDYPRDGNLEKFLKTLISIEASGVRLLNPLKTIQWNSTKKYLKELSKKFSCIESVWLSGIDVFNLERHMKENRWSECVIKPVISGGGFHTYRFKSDNVDEIIQKCAQAKLSDWILQPFMQEIEKEGEWSFIILNGLCVHAVLSKPAPNNFLVQVIHGGIHTKVTAPSWMIQYAERVIAECEEDIGIARVDLIRQNEDSPKIMEVEAIEPYLFFDGSERLQKALAQTIVIQLCKLRQQNSREVAKLPSEEF